jgi:tripartite-type tricarboxylate transporter receptor subunit TctC
MITDDQMILVRSDSKWKTLKELVDDALANPGKQIWGRGLPAGTSTLSQLIFLRAIPGIKVTPIPFDGGGELMTALLGGHVDVATAEYVESRAQIDSGKFRALAVLGENRQEVLPNVPTAKELGYDATMIRPRGFLVPKNTPPEVADALRAIFKSALNNEKFVKDLKESAATIAWQDGAEFGKTLDEIYQSYLDIDLRGLAAQSGK